MEESFGVKVPETSRSRLARSLDVERSLVVAQRRRIIATLGAYEIELSLPGGVQAPAVALIDLCVLPEVRGRGHLRSLVTRYLADARERREPLAVLNTDELELYARFGFGVASFARRATLSGAESTAAMRDPSIVVEELSHLEATAVLPELFCAVALCRTGEVTRTDVWWGEYFDEARRHEETTTFLVAHRDGVIEGYAVTQRIADGASLVAELAAIANDVFSELVCDVVARADGSVVRFQALPVDAPLREMLADGVVVTKSAPVPQSWLRIADVQQALVLRRYGSAGVLDFFVDDPTLPSNTGCYRLEVESGGAAVVEPSDAAPELSLDVAALASIFAGASTPSSLSVDCRLIAHREGALALADDLFATATAPFSSTLL